MIDKIFPDSEELKKFCQTNHITKMSLFGDVVHGIDAPDSEVDVLVEFDPDHIPGLIRYAGMQNQLSDMLGGRPVDLRTKGFLSPQEFARAIGEAENIYAS
ncbi:MAG: nucleotidyltransferase domain-containing protein [Candidatus Symbiobacter sp.]|nr:nucleotidyltransferase domain-containing protein [Candidatus Symbiobacter sp.]